MSLRFFSAIFGGGGERRRHYNGIWVDGLDAVVGNFEEGHILFGVYGVTTPFTEEVRLVPYLVVLDLALVARGDGGHEVAVVLVVGGRAFMVGLYVVAGLARPHRGAVEASHDGYAVGDRLVHYEVIFGPGTDGITGVASVGEIALGADLDVVPGEVLPYPLEAACLCDVERLHYVGGVRLFFEKEIDAHGVYGGKGN